MGDEHLVDGNMDEEGDVPQLSSHTLAALSEFFAERESQQKENFEENWQLSQFWYSKETAEKLAAECLSAVDDGGRIACISCPTLVEYLLRNQAVASGRLHVSLFEYDDRFASKYPQHFVSYDYRQPLQVASDQRGIYDLVIADPPFLSDECLVKVAQSVRLLAKDAVKTKLIICTGAVMQNMVEKLFSAHRCTFRPTHEKNLANEFACFANYNTKIL